jgi:16S rRNA (guanine(966)-N(2))-methyltransferase RsmD
MLRIIGGEFRSRTLAAPPDAEVTRPMASRAKESIFNLLRGWFENASVIDLFAGVGTMGLEAISRGAAHVLFVEQSRPIVKYLRENIEALDCEDRATVVQGDALSSHALSRARKPVQVMFVDPPYELMRDARGREDVFAQVRAAQDVLDAKSFVVLRAPKLPPEVLLRIDGFQGPETHKYGSDMLVHLYMPVTSRSDE